MAIQTQSQPLYIKMYIFPSMYIRQLSSFVLLLLKGISTVILMLILECFIPQNFWKAQVILQNLSSNSSIPKFHI